MNNHKATIVEVLSDKRVSLLRTIELYTNLLQTKKITKGEIPLLERAQSQIVNIDAALAWVQSWDAQPAPAQPQVPDWSQAPEWAMWWAKDKDGERYFYEVEPSLGKDVWHSSGRYEKEEVPTSNSWRTLKAQRPSVGDDK